jgi:superoxide dismutase, Fe-Mn family
MEPAMLKLPPLPYAYEALEPVVSAVTMRTHHDKHHAKYVETVNKLAADAGLDRKPLEEIIAEAERRGPGGRKLLNNAGQAWNHAFFWDCMTPDRRDPTGELETAIGEAFGGLEGLKQAFVKEGAEHFGSGWVWLVAEQGRLGLLSTHDGGAFANRPQTPLITCDLWEHAYYLDYKQDRKAFLERWFDGVANWAFAETQFAAASGQGERWHFELAA